MKIYWRVYWKINFLAARLFQKPSKSPNFSEFGAAHISSLLLTCGAWIPEVTERGSHIPLTSQVTPEGVFRNSVGSFAITPFGVTDSEGRAFLKESTFLVVQSVLVNSVALVDFLAEFFAASQWISHFFCPRLSFLSSLVSEHFCLLEYVLLPDFL